MAKREVYEPGELYNVKKRLGAIDEKEAKRMQRLLGGEVGDEKSADLKPESLGRLRHSGRKNHGNLSSKAEVPVSKPKHLVEVVPAGGNEKSQPPVMPKFQRTAAPPYRERVKMDICAGSSEFGIKTMGQILI